MTPERITVHCSANKKGRYLTVNELRRYHVETLKWSDVGYHYVIRTDGAVDKGRPLTQQGAHVRGHNKNNIGICLIGGLDAKGKPSFTYTDAQMHALYGLVISLCLEHGISYHKVCGHRDFSPDLNGDGEITSDEFIKDCPCFDVKEWLSSQLQQNGVKYELD
ncbi:MAG: putative endolysin [Prokaryotic dsDNA virus sp.]|nr:MAG: putative endolysin [Prokaryotic dsDNA virus sp.]|tara:strand:- start:432 stop:920 length:489 start_codon:yes stop_codon:yes gene_type:complete